MSICEIARQKLANDERSTALIASELQVSSAWIRLFVRRQIKSPSSDVVERIIAHYGGKVEVRFDQ